MLLCRAPLGRRLHPAGIALVAAIGAITSCVILALVLPAHSLPARRGEHVADRP